jgi:predicted lipoprotein
VEFARLANELNFKVRDEILAGLSYDQLMDTEVDVVAVFSYDPKNLVHVMTPVGFSPVSDGDGVSNE